MVVLISLTSMVLLAFLIILGVQRLGGSSTKSANRSTVPWIHPGLLRELPRETLPFRKRPLGPDGTPQSVLNPQLFEVTPWDWERIPGTIPPTEHQTLSSEKLAQLQNALLRSPGSFIFRSPSWPVCCSQLAVLVHSQGKGISLIELEREYGALDRSFLENELRTWGGPQAEIEDYFSKGWTDVLEQIRAGSHSGEGINFFRCSRCDRIYIGSCSP